MMDGVPESLLDTAKVAMMDAGLPVDWRRVTKLPSGGIEINLHPDMDKVLNPPKVTRRSSRRRA